MKRVTAIVRPEKMEALKDALFAADVSGMTISQVHGCGAQHGWSEYVRGTEVLLNMVPKVKFEIVVDDGEVDGLVDTIVAAARTGEVGDGKIFVAPDRCGSERRHGGERPVHRWLRRQPEGHLQAGGRHEGRRRGRAFGGQHLRAALHLLRRPDGARSARGPG